MKKSKAPTRYDVEHKMYVREAHTKLTGLLRELMFIVPAIEKSNVEKLLGLCNFQKEVAITDRLVFSETIPRSRTPQRHCCLYALIQYLIVTYDAMMRSGDIMESAKEEFDFFMDRFQTIVHEGVAQYRVRGNPEDGYQLVHVKHLQI